MADTILQIENIKKSFGGPEVLSGIDLSIARGEFITILGSSGCGKTTLLRIIAGLEQCDAGRVLLEGEDVTNRPPEKRDVNTIFQNYALFPHMDVAANIGYGLKVRRLPKNQIARRVSEALALVQLSGFEGRYPSELSGGQRQRVAIARAIVAGPKVLLLDEPLGALDLQLRRQMQLELKRLQKQVGITFIYITHDQEEALNMSDRIAVMRDGLFEQVGTPNEIYLRPRTSYVARFVGSANIVCGPARICDGRVYIRNGGLVPVDAPAHAVADGRLLTAAVRSEQVRFGSGEEGIPGIIKEKSFSAGMLRIAVEIPSEFGGDRELIVSRHGIDYDVAIGESVRLTWDAGSAVLVDAEG